MYIKVEHDRSTFLANDIMICNETIRLIFY